MDILILKKAKKKKKFVTKKQSLCNADVDADAEIPMPRFPPFFSKFDKTYLIKQKCVNFCCIHYQIYFIQ